MATLSNAHSGRAEIKKAEARAQRRRDALLEVFAQNDLTPTDAARQSGMKSPNALFNFIHGRTRSLSQESLEKLSAIIPGATIDLLLGNETEAAVQSWVAVRTYARMGDWRAGFDLPLTQQVRVPAALRESDVAKAPFGVEVHYPGAETLYAKGTTLVVVPVMHALKFIKAGQRVILQRMQDRKMEVSVREVNEVDGRGWLMPGSTDPKFQTAVPMPENFTGQIWKHGDMRLAVAGLVIMASSREVSF